MKQSLWGVIAAAGASVVVVVALQAQEHRLAKTPPPPVAQPAKEAKEAKEEGTAVFTFPDDATMQAFATLWQQRQVLLTKAAVLQDYWKQEQANLAHINQQLLTDYHLDVKNNYTLDRDKRVLIERAPSAEPPAPDTADTAQPPAIPSSP